MTQAEALTILKTGANVFLTGEPGAGKTYVINQYINWLEAAGLKVAVTASTGIAATHIGGMTIHSWSGVGARDSLDAYALDQITTKQVIHKRVGKASVLIIDEISMLDGKLLDMVNKIAKVVRGSQEPFGGLQVIFVGDFFQLPPVTRQGDVMRYAFESPAWEAARPLVCYLDEQFRQEDEMLLGLLKSIRRNQIEEDHYTLLQEQKEIGYEGVEPTRLYTHNADVDAVNSTELAKLTGRSASFKMQARGSKALLQGLVKSCLSPEVLHLKIDAMVMCTKNNFEGGYVNGTLGRVVDFDGLEGHPVIETATGARIKIKPMKWDVNENGKVMAELEQIPLRLAWAITVHKSQGMSLDAAEIDLSRAFVYGQGYVALSRVRTLTGLKVLGMHPNALQVDPKVVRQDERFRSESDAATEAFTNMSEEEVAQMHSQFVTAHGGRIPKENEVEAVAAGVHIPRESTQHTTLTMLREGKTPAQIAKERKLAETTIWGHLETLLESGQIERGELEVIAAQLPDWSDTFEQLVAVMQQVGTEKLKPIYEAAGEKYDYNTVRIARMLFVAD